MAKIKKGKTKAAKPLGGVMVALTDKQQAFVNEYLIDMNGTQAAIRAGYSPRTANEQASRLLANVNVKAAVEAAKKEREKRSHVDQDYVLNTIVDTVERCRQARPVLDRKGNPVMVETPTGDIAPAYVFDPDAVLKGADQLAKHVGFYDADNVRKLQLTGKNGKTLTIKLAPSEAYKRLMG